MLTWDGLPPAHEFTDAEQRGSFSPEDLDDDPECTCVQTDVDQFDSRDCLAHGPHSAAAKRQREQEAADEAEAARRIGVILGFDEDV